MPNVSANNSIATAIANQKVLDDKLNTLLDVTQKTFEISEKILKIVENQ